jgi:hypothetical protein
LFPNQHVYELVERVCQFMDDGGKAGDLEKLREGGRETAASFSPDHTAKALVGFFSRKLQLAHR